MYGLRLNFLYYTYLRTGPNNICMSYSPRRWQQMASPPPIYNALAPRFGVVRAGCIIVHCKIDWTLVASPSRRDHDDGPWLLQTSLITEQAAARPSLPNVVVRVLNRIPWAAGGKDVNLRELRRALVVEFDSACQYIDAGGLRSATRLCNIGPRSDVTY